MFSRSIIPGQRGLRRNSDSSEDRREKDRSTHQGCVEPAVVESPPLAPISRLSIGASGVEPVAQAKNAIGFRMVVQK